MIKKYVTPIVFFAVVAIAVCVAFQLDPLKGMIEGTSGAAKESAEFLNRPISSYNGSDVLVLLMWAFIIYNLFARKLD